MNEDKQASTHYQISVSTVEITMPDGSPATLEMLYEALNDEDAEVSVSAALGLAKLGELNPTVINRLFNAADWRSYPEAGTTARAGIAELAKTNPVVVDLLLTALQENQGQLSGVAECLGEIDQATPTAIDGLLAFSQRSDDPYAVVSALRSLLQLGYENHAIVERLLALYEKGDGIVHSVVLRAFGLLQQPSPDVIQLLIAASQSKAPDKRDATNLPTSFDSYDLAWLEIALAEQEAEDGFTRRDAIKSLGAIQNPSSSVIDALCSALSDPQWSVRWEAIDSLGRIGNPTPEVIEALLALLTVEEEKEQARRISSAQPSLGKEEEEEDIRAILNATLNILNEEQSLRGNVAMTLAQMDFVNDAVIAAFLAELGAADGSVRERIVRNWWLLGKDNPSVLEVLQSALQDESEMVRLSAAASLKRLG